VRHAFHLITFRYVQTLAQLSRVFVSVKHISGISILLMRSLQTFGGPVPVLMVIHLTLLLRPGRNRHWKHLSSRSARSRPGTVERVTRQQSKHRNESIRRLCKGLTCAFFRDCHVPEAVVKIKSTRSAPGERLKRQKHTSTSGGDWDSPWVGLDQRHGRVGNTEEHLLRYVRPLSQVTPLILCQQYRKHPAKTISRGGRV